MGTRISSRASAARQTSQTSAPVLPADAPFSSQAPRGTTRACLPYRDELLRHRVITADGHDFVVASLLSARVRGYLTCAYPVQHGYLVLVRQPLCELRSATEEDARAAHAQLLRVLSEAGTGVVRARRNLAARSRAEHATVGVSSRSLASLAAVEAGVNGLVDSLLAR